jgi:hypothetical protein
MKWRIVIVYKVFSKIMEFVANVIRIVLSVFLYQNVYNAMETIKMIQIYVGAIKMLLV